MSDTQDTALPQLTRPLKDASIADLLTELALRFSCIAFIGEEQVHDDKQKFLYRFKGRRIEAVGLVRELQRQVEG